ncbi:MAG: zinc-dependent alcohol dehydrogenase family protein [Spirochaetota bacterium]
MSTMKVMRLERIEPVTETASPLTARRIRVPEPGAGEVRIHVSACGVCHTELDEIEGRTVPSRLPVIPGHEIIGRIDAVGELVTEHAVGDRVGVGWYFDSCGRCTYCRSGRENLCEQFTATGRDADGGYAEYVVVPERSAHPIPDVFEDSEAAPLLCAGAVGYRALLRANLSPDGTLGFFGFGASAHLVLQMARHLYPEARMFVFTRSGVKQRFARSLGAHWAGAPGSEPPEALDAAIDTTPVWEPILEALRILAPGGRLVVNAIRKEGYDRQKLAEIDYARHLWEEKELTTVANVTREDIRHALETAAEVPVHPTVKPYTLREAGRALIDLKYGRTTGAGVLIIS